MPMSLRKLVCLFIFFTAISSAYLRIFPLYFFDDSYAHWSAKWDVATGEKSFATLIFGDSKAEFGIDPRLFAKNESVYSLAINGTSPVEAYFLLKEYLLHHPAPKKIIYSFSPIRFMKSEYFWSNTVKYKKISFLDLYYVLQKSFVLDDNVFAPLEFTNNIFCKLFYLGLLQLNFPYLFIENISHGGGFLRKDENNLLMNEIRNGLGYFSPSLNQEKRILPGREAHKKIFLLSPTIDYYFTAILGLADEKKISVFFVNAPTNAVSYGTMEAPFMASFESYIEKKASLIPFIIVNKLSSEDIENFADQDHLNSAGAKKFTKSIATKIFKAGL